MIIPVIYGVIIILIIQKTLVLDKVKFILFLFVYRIDVIPVVISK